MVLHFQNVTITMVTSKFLGHSSRQGRHLLSFKLQKVWNICPLDNDPSKQKIFKSYTEITMQVIDSNK